jgi:methanogenic corrinoid protein MtbC1
MRVIAAAGFAPISSAYSTAIEAGSYHDAQRVVQAALDAGATGAEIFARVLTPAMYRIGERWERAEINAADEHLATAISNRVMSSVYESLAVEMPTSRERVLIAAVEGDQHVMGLRMIADVLEGSGYDTVYMGADTPLAGLIASLAQHQPSVVALGATAPWSASKLVESVLAIRAADPALPIVLGGAQAERAAAAAADDLLFLAADAESVVGVVALAVCARSARRNAA